MRNRGVFKGDSNHLRAGHFAGLANRIGDLTGFAESDPHAAMLVADDDQRTEIKTASAFDDFGGALDEHNLLGEFLPGMRIKCRLRLGSAATAAIRSALAAALLLRLLRRWLFGPLYFGWFCHHIDLLTFKLQTRFAGRIGQ